MIEVEITSRGGELELGRIRIENIQTHEDGTADYSVQFATDRVHAIGMHQRVVYNFPRTKYNVLALLKQALETLEPEELSLEPEVDSSDLARRQRGTLPALQAGKGKLRNNRSSFWRR